MPEADRAIPQFHIVPVQNNFRSAQEGRAVFEDKEFVRIITPGVAKSIPDEEVTDEHKARWPGVYAAFKAGQEEPLNGTALSEWPAITASMALNLKAIHVRTVEDLASLDDASITNVGIGGRDLRARAKAWLEAATSSAPLERALAAEASLTAENTALKAQVRDLSTRLQTAEDNARARSEP